MAGRGCTASSRLEAGLRERERSVWSGAPVAEESLGAAAGLLAGSGAAAGRAAAPHTAGASLVATARFLARPWAGLTAIPEEKAMGPARPGTKTPCSGAGSFDSGGVWKAVLGKPGRGLSVHPVFGGSGEHPSRGDGADPIVRNSLGGLKRPPYAEVRAASRAVGQTAVFGSFAKSLGC